jgi:hypothetical protein
MDEEIREEQLDGDDDEQDVEGHAMNKSANLDDDDEEQVRSAIKK